MTRSTSIKAYRTIKENGMLSQKRLEAYEVLFKHGPATAMELRKYYPPGIVDSQIRARLNELRACGVAYEVRERPCSITGMSVIEWDVNEKLPVKLEKPIREKCKSCNGKGYVQTQQTRFNV